MLNIKEIAKLAGFSSSTVSKVMNGKDAGISLETRERILQIIKEYNYIPYPNLRKQESKSFLVAVFVSDIVHGSCMLDGIVHTMRTNGYSVLLNFLPESLEDASEDVMKALFVIAKQNPDGILWENAPQDAQSLCDQCIRPGVPLVSFGGCEIADRTTPAFLYDIRNLGYDLTEWILSFHHRTVACLVDAEEKGGDQFADGFRTCLFDQGIPVQEQFIHTISDSFSLMPLILKNVSAVVCSSVRLATMVFLEAHTCNLVIPRDLSVVALRTTAQDWVLAPVLSGYEKQDESVGSAAAQELIYRMEHVNDKHGCVQAPARISGGSVAKPYPALQPRILVIGSVNMDVLLHCPGSLTPGTTSIVKDCRYLPGGKGANQAVAVSKMNVPVRLLARIGKDADGLSLFNQLHDCHVEMQHVILDGTVGTGRAYIYVPDNGESAITVFLGANEYLNTVDIDSHLDAFDNVSFCLLQTELSSQTVIHAVSICQEKQIKIILKPATLRTCEPSLLRDIDYFVPNELEAKQMRPQCTSWEERAREFRAMGAKHVIITLGGNGCYYQDDKRSLYVSPAPFVAVDTTGAADAFIAVLACWLYRGADIVQALKYATYAAGASITKEGSQTALIDEQELMRNAINIETMITVTESKEHLG